jgi:hypothetical protein
MVRLSKLPAELDVPKLCGEPALCVLPECALGRATPSAMAEDLLLPAAPPKSFLGQEVVRLHW